MRIVSIELSNYNLFCLACSFCIAVGLRMLTEYVPQVGWGEAWVALWQGKLFG